MTIPIHNHRETIMAYMSENPTAGNKAVIAHFYKLGINVSLSAISNYRVRYGLKYINLKTQVIDYIKQNHDASIDEILGKFAISRKHVEKIMRQTKGYESKPRQLNSSQKSAPQRIVRVGNVTRHYLI